MKFLDWLFGGKSQPKRVVKNPEDKEIEMVGEPVISFVKCLKSDPKRFKLTYHTQDYAVESGLWGEIYGWMSKDSTYTGYAKLLDRKEGDEYYAIIHKGRLYRVEGIKFSLNGWELVYLMKSFMKFREKARHRKEKIVFSASKRRIHQKDYSEQLERKKLMEKFI